MAEPNGQPRNGKQRRSVAQERQRTLADVEAGVLGGILLRNDLLEQLSTLEVDDFAVALHRQVFQAMRNLEAARLPCDAVTLAAELARAGVVAADETYLNTLALRVPATDNVHAYVRQLKGQTLLRRVASITTDIAERALDWSYEPDELLGEAVSRLARVQERRAAEQEDVPLISVGRALEELESLANAPIYPTPFPTLNDAIGMGGLLGTQVYTLAAGTGRGKTSWVAAVAAHSAQTVPVLVASYEMKPGYFVARRAAGTLNVHSNAILRRELPDGKTMRDVLAAVPYGRLFMLHRRPLSDLRIAIARMTQRFGMPPLVIVDYLQKLANMIAREMQRPDARQATTDASETLCEIADASGSAIISVSAIGRMNNRRTTNPRALRPYELVDVSKESGAVEYDGAGMIVLSLSDEYDADGRIATMTLAKARFGEECHIDARYLGHTGDWTDRGRITQIPAAVANLKPGANTVVRDRITAALRRHGAVPSQNKLAELVGGTKSIVIAEIKAMVEASLVIRTGRGLALVELPSDVPAQVEFGPGVTGSTGENAGGVP